MTIKTETYQLQCMLVPSSSRTWKLVRPDGKLKFSPDFPALLDEMLTYESAEVRELFSILLKVHTDTTIFEVVFDGSAPSLDCMELTELAVTMIELFTDGKLVVRTMSAADNPLNPCYSLADALDKVDLLADTGADEKLFLRTIGQIAAQCIRDGDLEPLLGGSPHLAELQAYLAAQ